MPEAEILYDEGVVVRLRPCSFGLALAGVVLLVPLARAAPPTVSQRPAAIHGGGEAASCEFPSSVALFENMVLCSGTLVHPRLVLTAAHCIGGGSGPSVISLGESAFEPARTVAVDHCRANPAATGDLGPWDYAYCLLAEPVEDVPPTPILMGCETEILRFGQPVVISGFGADDRDQSGIKRWAETVVSSQVAGEVVLVGAEGTAACSGDSGGPAYVRLGDGGWRAFGIVSGGIDCDGMVTYVTMHSMIGWVEQETGMDFTPCHDADGTWNPGPACGGAAASPEAPPEGAAWPSCGGPRVGPSSTCGPAFGSEGDLAAPEVAILAPEDGSSFAELSAEVVVEVLADDGLDGGGVERVEIFVDGVAVASKSQPPWEFSASFPAGQWTVHAEARDWWGNLGVSDPVGLAVGEVPGEEEGTGESGGEASGESGEGDPGELDGPGTCSCHSGSSLPGVLTWLAMFGILRRARRRRPGLEGGATEG